jgi:hypothetical protein
VPIDITQKLTKTASQSSAEFDALLKRLKELKNPSKMEPGETTKEYLSRVNEIFMTRALYVSKLRVIVQDMLESKMKMQGYIDLYKQWAEEVKQELSKLPQQYQAREEELVNKNDEARIDIQVLADMIRIEAAKNKDKEDLIKFINEDVVNEETLKEIEDKNVRLAKFAGLDIEQKESKLLEMIDFFKDSRFEIDLLKNSIITETTELAKVLPGEHLNRIKEMQGIIQKSKDLKLEDQAVQISILAEYYGKQLLFVEPRGEREFLSKLKIEQEMAGNEKKLNEFLELTKSSSSKFSANKDLKIMLSTTLKEKKNKK